jgi:mersacidin/lichenicidin family type 2 lantibiotic
MTTSILIRSWRDEDFTETLAEGQKAELLPNPAGELLLSIIQQHEFGNNSTSLSAPTHCSTSLIDCCGTSLINTCSTSLIDCCN